MSFGLRVSNPARTWELRPKMRGQIWAAREAGCNRKIDDRLPESAEKCDDADGLFGARQALADGA